MHCNQLYACLAKAQPSVLKAMQTCTDALEHAAWTKGSRHMQPLTENLNWFQHTSLDVILFLAALTAALASVAALAVASLGRRLLRWLARSSRSDHAHAA